MAFLTGLTPSEALRSAKGSAAAIKGWWAAERAKFLNQNIGADKILEVNERLKHTRELWARAAAVPGIADYAQEQYSDPDYNVAAAFTAMATKAESVHDWLVAAWNANASGYVTLAKGGAKTIKEFTPTQLTEFVTRMDALTATIAE